MNNPYDVIIMSHVLEHLTAPVETLQWAYDNLKPKGLFYIEVPNSLNFIEPHLSFWTSQTLIKMYSEYLSDKFTVEEFGNYGPIYYFTKDANGDWQKFLQTNILSRIPNENLFEIETPNGVYLRILLKKKQLKKFLSV